MHEYELVTILSSEIKDEDVPGTIDRVNQFITNRGGEVQHIDQWGRRKLAYPIARQFEGTYVVTLLRLPPAQAVELEANLSISEDILRHLLVRYSPAEAAAALAASQRRRPQARPDEAPAAESGATVQPLREMPEPTDDGQAPVREPLREGAPMEQSATSAEQGASEIEQTEAGPEAALDSQSAEHVVETLPEEL